MKYLALALALLLAIGSQAAPMSTNYVISQLNHMRAAMDGKLQQMQDIVQAALLEVENDIQRRQLEGKITRAFTAIRNRLEEVRLNTDQTVRTAMETTEGLRQAVHDEIEKTKTDLEPKYEDLLRVVNKHLGQYREMIEPAVNEYTARHQAEMEALNTKMEPIVEALKTKLVTNSEETRNALMPILDILRSRVGEWLEATRTVAEPYIEEYGEHMSRARQQFEGIRSGDLAGLRASVMEKATSIRDNLDAIKEDIVSFITGA